MVGQWSVRQHVGPFVVHLDGDYCPNVYWYNGGRIQDSPGQGDNLISWYIEYSYQNNFVRKLPLTVLGYQVVPKEQIFDSISDI